MGNLPSSLLAARFDDFLFIPRYDLQYRKRTFSIADLSHFTKSKLS